MFGARIIKVNGDVGVERAGATAKWGLRAPSMGYDGGRGVLRGITLRIHVPSKKETI